MRPILTLALVALSTPALADGYASAQAQASTGYATPQAALVTPQAALVPQYDTGCGVQAALAAPAGCSYGAALQQQQAYAPAMVLQSYVQPQAVIVQRQVVAQPVYVQRQVVLRQQAYTPVLQQAAVVTPYVQSQALAQVGGYGTVGAQNGLVANRGVRQRAQKTVTRSRAVTVTRRPGVLNGLLGR